MDIDYLLTLPTEYYDIQDVIHYPPISLSASSLTPLEKVYAGAFIMTVQPQIIVELGILKAVTTEYFCDFVEANHLPTKIYGFDLPHVVEDLRANNQRIQELEASGRLILVPGSLPDSLSAWLESHNNEIDFVLVDAVHDYKSVTSELELLWKRLAPRGVILCHDYDDNEENNGVLYAVDRFAARKRDAHVMSLITTPDTDYERVLREGSGKDLEKFMHFCTLAVIRRRPYKPKLSRLLQHLRNEWQWKRSRRK